MPFGDGTGPLGKGPGVGRRMGRGMGRGAGFCGNANGVATADQGNNQMGRGRGGGMRAKNRFFFARQQPAATPAAAATATAPPVPATNSRASDVGALKAQAASFERSLAEIRKRIEGLKAQPKPE